MKEENNPAAATNYISYITSTMALLIPTVHVLVTPDITIARPEEMVP